MAEDAIALLNYVGWTEHRDLHVVGVSLGGMIAQGEHCSILAFIQRAKDPGRALSQNTRAHHIPVSSRDHPRRPPMDELPTGTHTRPP